ncbi:Pre-mRNA-splicing factor SYF2 [Nakaseomyces bracarensis]|uniref:Pre-mRNA-splicing factor SYF2 n=1 Tax=Nakaseomyces bracarensis TaxID=273131 RepID=A0ABR4NPD8_9SACH
MNLEEYSSRLRQLKRSIQDIKVHNRKLMAEERSSEQDNVSGKPKVYSMRDDEDGDEEKRSSDEQSDMRTNLFNYTVQDFINWEKKQDGKKRRGGRQYLAKRSYDKDLETALQKQFGSGQADKPRETEFKIHKSTGKVHLKDDKKLVDQLAQNLIATSDRRYELKKKELEANEIKSTGTNSVNDKNRHFNQTLDKR